MTWRGLLRGLVRRRRIRRCPQCGRVLGGQLYREILERLEADGDREGLRRFADRVCLGDCSAKR